MLPGAITTRFFAQLAEPEPTNNTLPIVLSVLAIALALVALAVALGARSSNRAVTSPPDPTIQLGAAASLDTNDGVEFDMRGWSSADIGQVAAAFAELTIPYRMETGTIVVPRDHETAAVNVIAKTRRIG